MGAMEVVAWVSHGRGADAEHGPPRQWSSDLKLLRECGVPSEARARPSDDGCVQPRRRPHQTGRYPPYQWFNRESATCASRQRAPRLLCRLFCCKRLALKDNDTVWYPALYHQRPSSRRGRRRLGDIHGHEAESYLVIGHLRGEGSSRCR